MIKFYNREQERAILESRWDQTDGEGRLALLTGRRRLGKTLIAKQFATNRSYFYPRTRENSKIPII